MVERPRFFDAVDGIFHGSDRFDESALSLEIGQRIRVHNYGSVVDEGIYLVGPGGMLYTSGSESAVPVTPSEVLSGNDGWEFDGCGLDGLPASILRTYFDEIDAE